MTFQERQKINYSNDECFEMLEGGVVSKRVIEQAWKADDVKTRELLKRIYNHLPGCYSAIAHFENILKGMKITLTQKL